MQKEILDLTKSLVGIKSVNGTAGERKVADYIYAYFRILNYYPSLSDSSFLKIDDDEASLEILTDNVPAFDLLDPLPLDQIKALDIPVMNIGTFGFDAHKWTERVNIPYTFGILPELEMKLIRKLFNK